MFPKAMSAIRLLTAACFLAPLLARADSLDVYALVTGKTVLMSSAVQAPPESLVPDPVSDKTNALAAIEKALAEQGVEIVQDGPHFVRLFPKSAWGFATNAPLRGAELAPMKGHEKAPKGEETLRPGTLGLSGADINQVLEIYGDMKHRTILRPVTLPAPTVRLSMWGNLTMDETVYAVETVLALNGLSAVEDGPHFVQVVPMTERKRVVTRAPKAEPGAKLFDPKRVPSTGFQTPLVPLTDRDRIERELEVLRQAFYEFMHWPHPHDRSVQRLLALYARLADKTAAATKASKQFDGIPIHFQVTTPLTKGELLYAIETTFTLNNLAIVALDEHRVRVGHISEGVGSAGKQPDKMPPRH